MRAKELFESSGAFPVGSFPFLLHVGSMDMSHKRVNSYEGAGLSFSFNPYAWQRIARGMVSGKIWKLTKPGNQFLDFHKLTKSQTKQIVAWGFEQGYIVPFTTYRVKYFDPDTERNTYTDFETREEAEEENEYLEGEVVESKDSFVSTAKLSRYCNFNNLTAINCTDYVAIAYAEFVLAIDGVWWNEVLDVVQLSAPRGVIFPARVASFKAELAGDDDVDDDEELW